VCGAEMAVDQDLNRGILSIWRWQSQCPFGWS